MLGNISGLQNQSQPQLHQQQGQQQQQQNQAPPPPPPLNGQDLNLSNILHFLQSEWRRYERERNEWEIERAEMRARIALLEGERRSFENTRIDLLRRIKMLEFALRMERSKQLNQPVNPPHQPKAVSAQAQVVKDESGSHKECSSGSSPHSEDVPLPSDSRMPISTFQNGAPSAAQNKIQLWSGSNWQGPTNSAGLGKPPPGRDPKSRARSREYLKQCLQEITYLTSPQAMNPLPNRPLISNPTAPPTLPNVPSLDQMIHNGRPRKLVPEVSKDYAVLNAVPIMSNPAPAAFMAASAPQSQALEKDTRMNGAAITGLSQLHSQPSTQIAGSNFQAQQSLNPLQTQQVAKETQEKPSSMELQQPASSFRSDDEWKERLVRPEKFGPQEANGSVGWDMGRDADEVEKEDVEMDEEGQPSTANDFDGKIWRPRRTLRNHLDVVRAVSFHPSELCLATGSDDCTVKVWRMDVASLTSSKHGTVEVEPQLTLRGHTAGITALVHSPNKRVLYSASLDSSIRVWALPPASHTTYAPYDDARCRGELVGHTDAVWDIALIRDESLLVSCGAEGNVKVWDVGTQYGTGSLRLSWGYNGLDSEDGHSSELPGATCLEAIKLDLKKIAVGFTNAAVKVFDVDTGRQLLVLTNASEGGSSASQVNSIASHPTMPMLVTAHEDKNIRIWDITTGQCTHSMLAHVDSVTSLSIDAGGFSLVSGGHDCSVRFWDLLGSRACVQEITSHREKGREGVLAVEFHQTLPFMTSAGADGTVKLYASS